MSMLRKQYVLDGLCCGNCAAKIEQEVRKLIGVSAAHLDFTTRILTVECAERIPENISEQAAAIAKSHDSDIVLQEKTIPQTCKKIMYLHGLDCADCARKIEAAVNRIEGVKTAEIDFVSQKLALEATDHEYLPVIVRQAADIIKNLEPNVKVSYTADTYEKKSEHTLRRRLRQIALITGSVLFTIGMIFEFAPPVELLLYVISYLLVGGEIVWKALKNITKGQVFDENFLMSIATIGAFAIGDYPEGVAVMLFYQVGEFFQDLAVNRSRKSITALMDIRPDYANLKIGDIVRKVSPEEVGIGDIILIRPGEKVPLDGIIIDGTSALNTSALTGEALPRDVEPGTEILSGSVNKNGLLTMRVTKEFRESTVVKILDLVQNASSQKAPTENFITKFARYYTPVVVFAALSVALIPPLVAGASLTEWINRALTFLVVSCPCALVISIPLSFFGGIGGASKEGILIKGSNYLEALNHVDTVLFDKTGTLTKGNFKVTKIEPANGWSQEDLVLYAAYAENFSNHPIAVSVREAFGREIDANRISDYEEISGHGIRVKIDGKTVLAGNEKLLMASANIDRHTSETGGTVVFLAVDNIFAGSILISDEIKADSSLAIRNLKAAGVKRTVMLTGDSKAAGEKAAKEIGLDSVYAELLPQQKVEQAEKLFSQMASGGKLVFVGDGINDAPVLARADVGVAMGGLGSDAAIEAADIILMTDEPSKLATAIRIARKTRSIVRQNILFAVGVKAVILILAAFGIATMWEAVFGDVGVTIIAVLNAMRATRLNKIG